MMTARGLELYRSSHHVEDSTFPEGHKARVKTFISCYRTPGPQKGFRRGVSEGVPKGFSKGFRRVLEGKSLVKPL